MQTAAITSHAALMVSPRLSATMPNDTAPNTTMAAHSSLGRFLCWSRACSSRFSSPFRGIRTAAESSKFCCCRKTNEGRRLDFARPDCTEPPALPARGAPHSVVRFASTTELNNARADAGMPLPPGRRRALRDAAAQFPSAPEVCLREIDDLVAATAHDRLHHEQREAFRHFER